MSRKGIRNSKLLSLAVLVGVALGALGCNTNRTIVGTDVSQIVGQTLDSLVGTITIALNDPERETAIAMRSGFLRGRPAAGQLATHSLGITLERMFAPKTAMAAACAASRFSPALGSASCGANPTDKTITVTYSSCSAGPSPQATLNGVATLVFSDKAACDNWIGGNVLGTGSATWTTTDFSRADFGGGVTTTATGNAVNYLGQTVGGGITTTFAGATRTVEVTGLRRTHSGGELGDFDHSVRTSASLSVQGSKSAGTRQITSGTFLLDDNVERFSASITASALTWSSTCCYPTSGTLSYALSGKFTGTASANFNTGTCGRVAIVNTFGQSATISLQACE